VILLDATTKKLTVKLGEAISTLEAVWNASYIRINVSTQDFIDALGTRGNTNGVTSVEMVPVPAAGQINKVGLITVINLDSVSHQIQVILDDSAVEFMLARFTIAPGDQLQYADGEGWRVFDSAGNLKQTGGIPGTRTINTTAPLAGGGDLSADRTLSLLDDGVTNAKLANVATSTFKGRVTAATGDPEDLTGTQATALLDVFTSLLKGLAPASGGGVSNFLRADGAWAAPTGLSAAKVMARVALRI